MSAEIPQNQIVIETSSSQQTEPLTTRQSACPVVQHHKENKPSDGQLQMNESDRSHSSQSLTHEAFEQVSDVDRGTCQPAQHLMPQSFLGRSPGQDELLLQLQVKQLQKVLQEQNALISLISPGLIVSPTFLTHLQAQTTSGFPHTIPVNLTENSAALKESSTKPTLFGEVENEPEGTGVTVKRAQSSESRSLSPIKEDCTESEEFSPFGSRPNVLANPEERPIRPGLREKQKTFEEFVEEHLKEQPDNQASTKVLQTTKKHFLRKGEGISRIGKGNDDSQMIRRRHSVNPQQQKICLNEVHQNGKKKEMLNESRTKQRRHSLPNTKDLTKYDLKEFQRKPLDPQDDNIQKQANIISSADSEVRPLTSSIVDNANSLKNKHSSEVLSIYGKPNESMSQKKALNKYKTAPAQSRDAPERNPSEENVGFKKINDHIVKVNERNGLPSNRLHGRSERSNETSKEFNLSNEVTESLALSDSNNSTSSEDGPISQSHRPLPQFPSRHTDHKDESLDLSDDDYASDAPSEIVSRFSEERRSSTPTSSSSRSSSDSELESLQESMTNHFKKTEDEHVSKWTRESVGLRPLCASERLTMETEQHGEEDHRPLTKEDPSETRESEDLRQQIFSLSQKLMEREVHWSHVQSLLQSRVEALTRENQELYSKLKGTERSQPGSYNRCDTSREDTQKTPRVRSETPAFNKPFIHKKETLTGHRTNGQSASKAMKMPEHTASSLRKNSACSVDFGNPDNNAMITRGGKESLFYHNVDRSDAQVAPHVRNDQVKEEIRYPDGRVERLFWNGCRVITFRNGTKKEIGVDKSVTVTFFNGDVKRILADGTVMYYYCDAQTTHSTYPSGLVVLQFPNNQREKRHPDGKREIIFPDGTVKILYPDGQEESIFPDGTVVRISKRGEKIVEFTNGQREIHTSQYKRRIYPDGTVKTVYTNGRQETKFSSGRVRIKNNEGFIIIDKK